MNTFHKNQRGAAISLALGATVAAVLFIYVLYLLLNSGTKIDPADASPRIVASRIQPVGILKVSDGIEPGMRSGEQVFTKTCSQCHSADAKVANSPKFSNTGDWAPRIAKGFEALMDSALNGFNAMPARGGASSLTDEEVARAVAYMANSAGGNFTAPPLPSEEAPAAEDAPAEDASAADTAEAAAQ